MADEEAKKTAAQAADEKPEVQDEAAPATEADVKAAKAGKRSSKSLKEAEDKVAKEERKAEGDTTPQTDEAKANVDKKGPAPKTRSRLERRGKNYRKSAEQVEKGKAYSLTEAITLATKTNPVKFDATVEMHINLNVDPRHRHSAKWHGQISACCRLCTCRQIGRRQKSRCRPGRRRRFPTASR